MRTVGNHPGSEMWAAVIGAAAAAVTVPSVLAMIGLLGVATPSGAAETSAGEMAEKAAAAVRAAQAIDVPSFHDSSARQDEVISAFGGTGTQMRESVADIEDIWQEGTGDIYTPATVRTIGCRGEEDPECRAIQILDRGFPERPTIDSEILDQRDAVIDAIDDSSTSGGTETCRDITVEIPETVTQKTCAVGTPYAGFTCLTGWEDTVIGTLTRWQCTNEPSEESSLTCPITTEFTTVTQTAYTCDVDEEALAPVSEETVVTSATATAVFPATCEATEKVVEKVTCSKILTVSGTATCTAGEVDSVTATGDTSLFNDSCPLGDTLTVSHTCALEDSDYMRVLTMKLNGFPAADLWGKMSYPQLSDETGTCKVQYQVTEHTCTESSDGLSCVARGTARVYHNRSLMGSVSALIAYTGYTEGGGMTETWTDGCSGIESETASSTEAAE
ncbi:hypothetical protein [Sutterella sp.]|uniref:hypothetical protein n=1 Tax=Sutterella sp. TaxID=1981025 RepID=UPI0026DF518F|nr:hypothetical protein [Sutterella sp.]MDO5531898.1 hypothetical protein [Sutterella sp.]